MRASCSLLVLLGLGAFQASCSAAGAGESTGELTVIHAGALLAVPGEQPLASQSIVIRDDRIVEIRPGYAIVDGAMLIDLRKYFVLPGLIDLHVHLTTVPEPGHELDAVTQTAADLALLAHANAQHLLAAGFTTVLDLGTGRRSHEEAVFALRDAIGDGVLQGPRVLAVGSPLSIPGQSRTPRFAGAIEAVIGPDNVCTGADACRRTVREQVKRGADAISFYNTGSLLSDPSLPQTFTDEEMSAIVDTAHALGRPVIADGGNTRGDASGINAALRAGVDSIDTVTWPDEETWRLLRKSDAYFVPHLFALDAAVGNSPETLEQGTMGWLPRPILEFLFDLKQEPPSAVAAHRAGVRFAFGSDPGVFPHGHNAREFPKLIEAGLTPMEAIVTATVAAADMLGRRREIGALQAGMVADMIATSGNPIEDVRALEEIEFVMKGGQIHQVPSRMAGNHQ